MLPGDLAAARQIGRRDGETEPRQLGRIEPQKLLNGAAAGLVRPDMQQDGFFGPAHGRVLPPSLARDKDCFPGGRMAGSATLGASISCSCSRLHLITARSCFRGIAHPPPKGLGGPSRWKSSHWEGVPPAHAVSLLR